MASKHDNSDELIFENVFPMFELMLYVTFIWNKLNRALSSRALKFNLQQTSDRKFPVIYNEQVFLSGETIHYFMILNVKTEYHNLFHHWSMNTLFKETS